MCSSEHKISIIIPVYNTEKYIERCIRSIIFQTYNNLEIICVNDGSTDMSGIILDRLSKEDSRIKVIHQENEGVSVARNTALSEATGDYIGFVDSDDYITADYCEKLSNAFKNEFVDIATCGYYFDFSGEIIKAVNKKKLPEEPMKTVEFLPYIYERDTYNGVAGYLWTRLVKRQILKNDDGSLKISFKKEFRNANDIIFIAEMNLESNFIQYIDKPLYYYCQRSNSIVHSDKMQLSSLNWAKAYEYIIEMYENYGVQKETMDYIRRMYVYRCGRLLEIANKYNDTEKAELLKKKIRGNLQIYIDTNQEHKDRIQWINDLIENTSP